MSAALPVPKANRPEQNRKLCRCHFLVVERSRQNSARFEVQRSRQRPSPNDRQHEQSDRRRQQDAKIDPPALFRFFGAVMRHQRIRGQRHDFVEHEQREHVLRKRGSHRGKDRNCEASKEPSLVFFLVSSHVADRVARCGDPKTRRDQREHGSQRFCTKRDLERRGVLARNR